MTNYIQGTGGRLFDKLSRQLIGFFDADGKEQLLADGALARQSYVAPVAQTPTSVVLAAAMASAYGTGTLQEQTYDLSATIGGYTLASNKVLSGAKGALSKFRVPNGTNAGYLFGFTDGQTDLTFEDIEFDCNAAGNAGQTLGGFEGGGSQTFITFRNCRFKGGRGGRPFLVINGRRWLFDHCTFDGHENSMITIGNNTSVDSQDIRFVDCLFTNYNSAVVNDPCVRMYPGATDTLFERCYFKNVASNQFAMETAPFPSPNQNRTPKNLRVFGCTFDGGGVGGTAISTNFDGAQIIGNTWFNGGAGRPYAMETSGSAHVISGNVLIDHTLWHNGSTYIASDRGVGTIISHNRLTYSSTPLPGASQIFAIQLRNQTNSVIKDNVVDMRAFPSGTSMSALCIGGHYSSVPVGSFNDETVVEGNNFMRTNNGDTVPAILVSSLPLGGSGLPGLTSRLKMRRNVFDGWYWCLFGDVGIGTDWEFCDNDCSLWGGNVILAAAMPTVRFLVKGNKTPSGILNTQAYTPAAAGTLAYVPHAVYSEWIQDVQMPAGNITIPAPPTDSFRTGQTLTFLIRQDGTGSRTITWNAVFKKAADGAGAANTKGAITFVYDGTHFVQQGGALVFF